MFPLHRVSFFRFGPQIGYQFSFDSSLNRAYWTLRRTNLSEINGISPRACRTILQSISHRESDTSSRNLVFCFCRLCLISRHFAVCILIQAKEGSKAALFGRRSIYSAYDLASWTSGDNLLMVKIEIYFRISFIYRLHHHMLCFTLLVTTF